MNKQSNLYTILYIIVLVVVVGAGLAFNAISLKDRQVANANADKMRQILAAAHIVPEKGRVVEDFNTYITAKTVYNDCGQALSRRRRRLILACTTQ